MDNSSLTFVQNTCFCGHWVAVKINGQLRVTFFVIMPFLSDKCACKIEADDHVETKIVTHDYFLCLSVTL